MRQGFYVFRCLSPSAPCDLIALKSNIAYRVEVTTVRPSSDGKIHHSKQRDAEKFDILACVDIEKSLIRYETSRIVWVQSGF